MDYDISDTAVLRIAGTKMDRDGVIFNAGTQNDVDDQDSWGLRSTLVVQMDDQNELTFKYERAKINDNRQNYGLSACNRNAFLDVTLLQLVCSLHQQSCKRLEELLTLLILLL